MKKIYIILALAFCLPLGVALLFENRRINKDNKEKDTCIDLLENENEVLIKELDDREPGFGKAYIKARANVFEPNKYYRRQLELRQVR